MPSLNSITTPVKQDFVKGIVDGRFETPVFLGLLMGLSNHYHQNYKQQVNMDGGVAGGPMSFLLSTEYGTWDGSNALPDTDLPQPRIRKKNNLFDVSFNPTALEYTNAIEKYDVNRYLNDPRLTEDLVMEISNSANKGLSDTLNNMLFPYANGGVNVNRTDGNGGVIPGNRTTLPALSRFLGSGHADNATSGGTNFEIYAGRNYLGMPARARAVQWGTGSSSVTLSWKNLLQNLISPMRSKRGAKKITLLVDSNIYHYLWDTAKDKVQFGAEMTRYWGGQIFGYDEMTTIALEPQLDLLTANGGRSEILAIDFETVKFKFADVNGAGANINVHTDVPGQPSAIILDGYLELGYGFTDVGRNGHGYNVVVP